ncbi:MAG: HYR domain-containing protein [Ignavibacteriae bacterium]|nr:HYR domain-containing protein [Ignavibacteriota bacterium]
MHLVKSFLSILTIITIVGLLLPAFSNAQIDNGLVAYYPFNGNANDATGNGNNGNVFGASLTTDRFGNQNSAYFFNGTSDSIQVLNSPSLNPQYLTLAAWVYYQGASYNGHIVSKSLSQFDLYIEKSIDNGIGGHVNNQPIRSQIPAQQNNWMFLCLIKDYDSVYLFKNGVKIKSLLNVGTIVSSPYNMLIGRHPTDANSKFQGKIDDIRIYNRALDAIEIQSLFHEGDGENSTGDLIAFYPFNGNANDESGNGLHGTVSGASLTYDRLGNENSAYSFNGSNNFITVSEDSRFNFGNQFTLVSWVNVIGNGRILSKGFSSNNPGYEIMMEISGSNVKIRFNMTLDGYPGSGQPGGAQYDVYSTSLFPINTWNQIAVTYDNSKIRFYINGSFSNEVSAIGTVASNNYDLSIGRRNIGPGGITPSDYFHGGIDDIRIYRRALNQQEIFSLYDNVPLPPTITCPDSVVVYVSNNQCQANVEFQNLLITDGATTVECSPLSGSAFPIGLTLVTCTATNSIGSATCSFYVMVIDSQKPTITLTVSPSSLWPPNHKLRDIQATVSVNDNCSGVTYVLTSITSNEPDNGNGDGDQAIDIQDASYGTNDLSFKLRAERKGQGSGRIYTIKYTATDVSGNQIEAIASVKVPHNLGKENISVINAGTPSEYSLGHNFPNPFNPSTVIRYQLPVLSYVSLKVFNTLGQEVATLADGIQDAGYKLQAWNATSEQSGVYFYRLQATPVSGSANEAYTETKKLLLVK